MIIALVAAIICAAAYYLLVRRAVSNFGDPVVFENMAIPFSAALLTVLCAADMVPVDKLVLFTVIVLGFLSGARVAVAFMGRAEFRRAIMQTVSRFSKTEIYSVLIVTMLVTLAFTALALVSGGIGDGRAEFNREFRPLAVLRNGLFLFSMLLLLSPKLSTRQAAMWLGGLILLSIAFSGKGVLAPVFYWVGLKFFVTQRKANFGTMVGLAVIMLGGVALMGFLAYDTTSPAAIFVLISSRFWMYGDVYIYAYKLGALAPIRGHYDVSFIAYMLHPITSLLGMRAYEKPLGAMLMSQVIHRDVLTGPNPQLPVLLDFFFPQQLTLSVAIAFAIGLAVFSIRAAGIRMAANRSRYLALGGMAAAIFGPGPGLVDTSQVLISLVSIAAVTVGCALLEMLAARRRQATGRIEEVLSAH